MKNQWQCPTCGTKQDAPTRPPVGAKVIHAELGMGVVTSHYQCDDGDCIVQFRDCEWVLPFYNLETTE